jgi:hypothetical protein
MLKIDPHGAVSLFAKISGQGLGHVCFKKDRFYVTAFASHEIYEVTLQGKVKRLSGEWRARDRGWHGHKSAAVVPQWNCLQPVGTTTLYQRVCRGFAIGSAASCDRQRDRPSAG